MDVEGDNDKSDNSFQSEKSEEDKDGDISVAVKSSIGEPGQGIKLTFTKKPKLAQFSHNSPFNDFGDSDREAKQGMKRKHSLSPDIDIGLEDLVYSSEGEGSSRSTSGHKPLTMKIRRTDNFSE